MTLYKAMSAVKRRELEAEIERLRAEVERLRAEIERLRAEVDTTAKLFATVQTQTIGRPERGSAFPMARYTSSYRARATTYTSIYPRTYCNGW